MQKEWCIIVGVKKKYYNILRGLKRCPIQRCLHNRGYPIILILILTEVFFHHLSGVVCSFRLMTVEYLSKDFYLKRYTYAHMSIYNIIYIHVKYTLNITLMIIHKYLLVLYIVWYNCHRSHTMYMYVMYICTCIIVMYAKCHIYIENLIP